MTRTHTFFALCCCLLLGSCSATVPPPPPAVVTPQVETKPAPEDPADLSCAYFYFLWGTHSEFQQKYDEALEAYEKASICDPSARYVKEKIPILLLKMGELDRAGDWLRQALIDDPTDNSSRLFLASLYIQQGQMDKAIELYDQVLSTDPDNESVQLRLGLLYSHQEQFSKAEAIFRRLTAKNGGSYFSHLSLARLLQQLGQDEEAGREFEKALALNWSKDLVYEIGNYYLAQKKYDDALHLYTTIIEQDPSDERAALSRVQVLLEMEKNDQALAELKAIRNFSKNPIAIDIITSKVLLRKNEVAQAREILDRLAKETGNSEAHYMLALLAYQEKNNGSALEHLGQIKPDTAEFEEAVYLQSRIYKETGRIDRAISLLKKHLASETGRSPLFYALLSSFYQDKNDYQAATALMETAIKAYPENPQLYFEYGLLLDKRGKAEQAMAKMEKVLELQPEHADALNYIGYTWADNNIHLDRALAYIQKAADLKPDNGYIVDSLGWAYYRLGNLPQAAKELERALELESGDAHIYEHLGDVYRDLGEKAKALQVYNKAYEMFAAETDKQQVKEKIDALEKK